MNLKDPNKKVQLAWTLFDTSPMSGEQFRKIRKEMSRALGFRMNQDDFGRMIGRSRMQVHRYEHEHLEVPVEFRILLRMMLDKIRNVETKRSQLEAFLRTAADRYVQGEIDDIGDYGDLQDYVDGVVDEIEQD